MKCETSVGLADRKLREVCGSESADSRSVIGVTREFDGGSS